MFVFGFSCCDFGSAVEESFGKWKAKSTKLYEVTDRLLLNPVGTKFPAQKTRPTGPQDISLPGTDTNETHIRDIFIVGRGYEETSTFAHIYEVSCFSLLKEAVNRWTLAAEAAIM